MSQSPEIVLPAGTEFVDSAKIPALIAEALHPGATVAPRTVVLLTKTLRSSSQGSTAECGGWSIDDEDRALLNRIWERLPKLVLPIAEDAWRPYAEAFKEGGKHLDWELGCRFHTPYVHELALRQATEDDHRAILRAAIARGELQQLSPASNLPSTRYLGNGKVSVEALTRYVAQFRIGVRCLAAPRTSDARLGPRRKNGADWTDDAVQELLRGRRRGNATDETAAFHGIERQRMAVPRKSVEERLQLKHMTDLSANPFATTVRFGRGKAI